MRPVNWTSPINWNASLNKGLVSWWLNVSHWQGGFTFRDLARDNDGNLGNGPVWGGPTDRRGGMGSLDFQSGQNHICTLPTAGSLNITTEITLSVWAKPVQAQGSAGGRVISQTNGSTGDYYGLILRSDLALDVRINNTFDPSATDVWVADEWSFFTMTFDGSDVRAHVNGVQVHTYTQSGPISSGNAKRIGQHPGGTVTRRFIGLLDDVRIYDRGLNNAEIFVLYEDSLRGYPETLRRIRSGLLPAEVAVAPPATGRAKFLPLLGVA